MNEVSEETKEKKEVIKKKVKESIKPQVEEYNKFKSDFHDVMELLKTNSRKIKTDLSNWYKSSFKPAMIKTGKKIKKASIKARNKTKKEAHNIHERITHQDELKELKDENKVLKDELEKVKKDYFRVKDSTTHNAPEEI